MPPFFSILYISWQATFRSASLPTLCRHRLLPPGKLNRVYLKNVYNPQEKAGKPPKKLPLFKNQPVALNTGLQKAPEHLNPGLFYAFQFVFNLGTFVIRLMLAEYPYPEITKR